MRLHPITRTVLSRLILGLMTLVLVSALIFMVVALLPGDFARAMLGPNVTPETVAAFCHEVGLDRPAVARYLEWISGAVRGGAISGCRSRAGQLMVDAVSKRDVPVVQACALIFAATYILMNLAADILTVVSNPRLLHPKEGGVR